MKSFENFISNGNKRTFPRTARIETSNKNRNIQKFAK